MAAILLVEDDASVREAVAMALEGDGHKVETAVSGDEALARWRSSHPDLIVLDVMLPGSDGVASGADVLSRLSCDPDGAIG